MTKMNTRKNWWGAVRPPSSVNPPVSPPHPFVVDILIIDSSEDVIYDVIIDDRLSAMMRQYLLLPRLIVAVITSFHNLVGVPGREAVVLDAFGEGK